MGQGTLSPPPGLAGTFISTSGVKWSNPTPQIPQLLPAARGSCSSDSSSSHQTLPGLVQVARAQ